MDLPNLARDAEIAAQRKQKEDFFNMNIVTLSDDERKKFDSLMNELLTQKKLDPILHKGMVQELNWEMLPVFLKDKWIDTFTKPNVVKRLLLAARNAISEKLKGKPVGFEVPDGEIIDKK